jgi:hypothetical protein
MATNKPRGSDDEVGLLISLRRGHAWEAMSKIMHGLARVPHEEPTIAIVLDYLSNMAYTLELMLKLLSGNWESHAVGAMYEKVFGQPHTNRDFMDCLKLALTNQKYLFEPVSDPATANSSTIANFIPEMESLFHALRSKMLGQHRTFCVVKEFSLPLSFGEFLRDHAGLFFKGETYHCDLTPEFVRQASVRHEEQLRSAASNIAEYLRMAKGVGVFQGTVSCVEALR